MVMCDAKNIDDALAKNSSYFFDNTKKISKINGQMEKIETKWK